VDATAEAYRDELRTWLGDHLTDRYRGLQFEGAPDADWLDRMREWNHLLADAGYAAPSWPVERGGRGAGVLEQAEHAREMAAARAPGPINALGIPNVAPAIMAFGTQEQQERFLRPLLWGDEIWCQGFSEPDAGSDLAALQATGTRDGDDYVLRGQKVWTTFGPVADWCELLVRTDPDADRPQAGITCLLVDMRLPGIEVRPLRTITGTTEFSEVFLDDVRVPVSARLGDEHDGWRVAMATLSNERGGVAALHLQLRGRIAELIDAARDAGRTADPLVRDRLARLHSAGECLRYLADRSLARAAAGLPPGPESSVIKIAWSLLGQDLPDVAVDVLGLDALEGAWGQNLLHARSLTIAGGTTEVNRNIVGERVLGLPRGPR
jgi:alkylation response protein AidB-like acyl-CoA dehydrogenase